MTGAAKLHRQLFSICNSFIIWACIWWPDKLAVGRRVVCTIEGDVIDLICLGLNGLKCFGRFDQGCDILPLRRNDDHDHQYTGYQPYLVNIPILHELNVWQFIVDANGLLGLANGR